MAKKKIAKKTEVSRDVEGVDAKLLINIYSPGHEPIEFRIKVKNIIGAANLLHRSPEVMIDAVKDGLKDKYGESVG